MSLYAALGVDANYLYKDMLNGSTASLSLDSEELQLIKKYRLLDEHGKTLIKTIFELEYERVSKLGAAE